MLRGNGKLRLSARDLRRWVRITGFEPVGIRCIDDLVEYVRACKAHFWGTSEDTRLVHWLIDEEFNRCVGGDDAEDAGDSDDRGSACIQPSLPPHINAGLKALAGGRAALERELLWLVALGHAETSRAVELHRMLTLRKIPVLRLVGHGSDEGAGADDPEPESNR
ncbi:hypothetical protein [Piscinibacter sp.]|uniref:hypothetical protein n=1 Tax=Piscinibacter sp. TaxID=1903157 RepID=UPI003559CE55